MAQQAQPAAGSTAPKKASLPEEALEQARAAEQHLAANQPAKAIEILQKLTKKYPQQSALSLRLAQIYDTGNRYGYALFYYRRYVQQAGPRAREMAVERVATLELMPGLDPEVKQAEKETGEQSRPVATPAPVVKRMLATEAKDGTLVPIRDEADYERFRRQGVPETAGTPMPTPSVTPIIIPPELSITPTPAPLDAYASTPPAGSASAAPGSGNRRGVRVEPSTVGTTAPPKNDEDALLAQAFAKAPSPSEMTTAPDPSPAAAAAPLALATSTPVANPAATPPGQVPGRIDLAPKVTTELAALPTPLSRTAQPPRQVPVSPHLSPSAPSNDPVAYMQATPAYDSAKAASFFNVTAGQGNQAVVSLLNEIPQSIVTISITPQDDRPVISAILTPKEQKRVNVPPGTYDVTANVSTTDYSPITLMNSQFRYTFTAGRQYTRRFNKTNIEQLN